MAWHADAGQDGREPARQLLAGFRSEVYRCPGRRRDALFELADAALCPAWIEFAGAAQVAQLRRTVTEKGKQTVEVVYLITSDRDASPATLAAWVRGGLQCGRAAPDPGGCQRAHDDRRRVGHGASG
jgi:hypothetical protein